MMHDCNNRYMQLKTLELWNTKRIEAGAKYVRDVHGRSGEEKRGKDGE